ncbi:hypothetical protein [Actinophytocola sp.]|uniref:hypothetical protein n=1 Tax=Actinophytocola sp. TaxID=1872138 RepID=UPI002ED116AE
MEVAVQCVRTWWTKRSRGGQEAARRNAAPIAFPLPNRPLPFLHEAVMHEHDGFQPRLATRDLPASSLDSGVLLKEVDELLRVHLVVTPYGSPRRNRRPSARRLAPGEWLRWQVNFRFSGYHEWSYRLDTYNAGYGPAQADLFLGTPTHHVDELAILF